jgi:hypothetical protein
MVDGSYIPRGAWRTETVLALQGYDREAFANSGLLGACVRTGPVVPAQARTSAGSSCS